MFKEMVPASPEASKTKMPSFDELKNALPEEFRQEFQELGAQIESIASNGSEGRVVEDEDLSEKEREVFKRHEELQKMAMESLRNEK